MLEVYEPGTDLGGIPDLRLGPYRSYAKADRIGSTKLSPDMSYCVVTLIELRGGSKKKKRKDR